MPARAVLWSHGQVLLWIASRDRARVDASNLPSAYASAVEMAVHHAYPKYGDPDDTVIRSAAAELAASGVAPDQWGNYRRQDIIRQWPAAAGRRKVSTFDYNEVAAVVRVILDNEPTDWQSIVDVFRTELGWADGAPAASRRLKSLLRGAIATAHKEVEFRQRMAAALGNADKALSRIKRWEKSRKGGAGLHMERDD